MTWRWKGGWRARSALRKGKDQDLRTAFRIPFVQSLWVLANNLSQGGELHLYW